MNPFYMEKLNGKSILITGGSSGIGAAAAKAFAQCGAKVCIAARSLNSLKEYTRELAEQGLDVQYIVCDITDYASVVDMYKQVMEKNGEINIVFANAGVLLQNVEICNSDPVFWAKTIETNLLGSYYTARAAIPYMKKSGGKILFTGSGRGRRAAAGLSDYACAKAGQWMLVRNLALELSKYHIAVNEIIPGPVLTNMDPLQNSNIDLVKNNGGEITKLPEDVTDMILYIASQSEILGPTGQAFSLNRREL